MKDKKRKIYILNARDNMIMELINSMIPEIHQDINNNFDILLEQLSKKGIDYYELKNALIPSRDEEKFEIAFIFNSKYLCEHTMFYGEEIFKKILPILNKESTQSIFIGDYVKTKYMNYNTLKEMFLESIKYINKCDYIDNMDFFIVYINNITRKQIEDMISKLKNEEFFVGFMELKYASIIKQYLTEILCPLCIKHKDLIIAPHLSDRDEKENYNETGYPYIENGFRFKSINEMLYNLFLAYKIENNTYDKDDLEFSYNIITKLAPEYNDIKVLIDENKLKYLKEQKTGTMKSLDLLECTVEELEQKIMIELYNNYIYNIEINKYNIFKFNVLIELQSNDKKIKRKVNVALEYKPKEKILRLITMY